MENKKKTNLDDERIMDTTDRTEQSLNSTINSTMTESPEDLI